MPKHNIWHKQTQWGHQTSAPRTTKLSEYSSANFTKERVDHWANKFQFEPGPFF
jgi:hypothetical protein